MATLNDNWNWAHDATLKARVAAACAVAAVFVLNEDPATANHANRLKLAWEIFNNPDAMATRMVWGVVGSTQVQTAGLSVTDANLQTAVNALLVTFVNGVA